MTSPHDLQPSFIRLVVEQWKLIRAFDRAREHVKPEVAERFNEQVRYARSSLDSLMNSVNMKLSTFDGEIFDAKHPVNAVNSDEYDTESKLKIAGTIEPTITKGLDVVHLGRVFVEPVLE